MGALEELYQQIIIEHNRSPRNFKVLPDATGTVDGDNPLCGDTIRLYVRIVDGRVADIGFQGKGCAISRASASLMTGAVKGLSVASAEALFHHFHAMVTGVEEPDQQRLGKLAALAGVRQFPVRVKCANLPWHTLHAALAQDQRTVTTE